MKHDWLITQRISDYAREGLAGARKERVSRGMSLSCLWVESGY